MKKWLTKVFKLLSNGFRLILRIFVMLGVEVPKEGTDNNEQSESTSDSQDDSSSNTKKFDRKEGN